MGCEERAPGVSRLTMALILGTIELDIAQRSFVLGQMNHSDLYSRIAKRPKPCWTPINRRLNSRIL